MLVYLFKIQGHENKIQGHENKTEDEDTDWEELNEKDRDESISNSLKKLGNVKKKLMSAFILKDMLGSDGEFSLQGIKESHLNTTKGE